MDDYTCIGITKITEQDLDIIEKKSYYLDKENNNLFCKCNFIHDNSDIEFHGYLFIDNGKYFEFPGCNFNPQWESWERHKKDYFQLDCMIALERFLSIHKSYEELANILKKTPMQTYECRFWQGLTETHLIYLEQNIKINKMDEYERYVNPEKQKEHVEWMKKTLNIS